MAGVQFYFAEIVNEIKTLKIIASDFLDPTSINALDTLRSNFESVWNADSHQKRLTLQPLRTELSTGQYEPGSRRGRLSVRAVITGRWDIRPLGSIAKQQKQRNRRLLEFCGLASTKVEIHDEDNPEVPLAMWRMELGAENAPGCYLHVHIVGEDSDSPCPHHFPIPRLPGLFITPMAAIEYVLGELFQDQWDKAISIDTTESANWRYLQQRRLEKILEWHTHALRGALTSPWMNLKKTVPKPDLFIS